MIRGGAEEVTTKSGTKGSNLVPSSEESRTNYPAARNGSLFCSTGMLRPEMSRYTRCGPSPALNKQNESASPFQKLRVFNEAQRALRSQAETMALDMGRTRLLLFEHLGSSIPVPFLVVLVFWLCIIFASFGLFAPRNATVIAVLCVCALSVSGAIFLILELDRSFEGLLKVSGAPLRAALAQLGG
jgi:hypothetical protein